MDANVVINWLLNRSSQGEQFFESLAGDDELIAAMVLLPECTSVLREEVFSRRVLADHARQRLEVVSGLPFSFEMSLDQFTRAFELAAQFQHMKAYDMQYVAVAELAGAMLVTGDRGSIHAAREIGVPVLVIQ